MAGRILFPGMPAATVPRYATSATPLGMPAAPENDAQRRSAPDHPPTRHQCLARSPSLCRSPTPSTPIPVLSGPLSPGQGLPEPPGEWPLHVVGEEEMHTPDVSRTYTHCLSIPAEMIPFMGQSFTDEEVAHKFYKEYARVAGFGICRGNKKRFFRTFKCTCVGKWEFHKPGQPRQRNKTTKKTSCKAKLKLKKMYDSIDSIEQLVVDFMRLEHNHPLFDTPKVTEQIQCHKNHDETLISYVDSLHESGVSKRCVMNIIFEMHGGEEQNPITERDLENRRAAKRREEHADDISKLLQFFVECHEQNPKFYWDAKLGPDGVIQTVFWSHASQQGEYADFGDVFTFDTTHRTNSYNMPLAMFVGGNNHLQNTIFGFALVGDETQPRFEWLFSTFKRCMGGHMPRCILTDQDNAMAQAISLVYPGVIHRLCRWHVLIKFMPLLNELYALHQKKDFKGRFHSVINHPLTSVEFEAAWKELLDDFGLHDDPTLQSLYETKEKWVPAYLKPAYCGRTTSTQRSESSNSMVKQCHIDEKATAW
ncbi:hypothetical protein ACP4OV_027402 [Aristida adscensionis]